MPKNSNKIIELIQLTHRLNLHLIQALETNQNDDTHHTDDHLAAAEGRIESISAKFQDLTINHTH